MSAWERGGRDRPEARRAPSGAECRYFGSDFSFLFYTAFPTLGGDTSLLDARHDFFLFRTTQFDGSGTEVEGAGRGTRLWVTRIQIVSCDRGGFFVIARYAYALMHAQ